MKPTLSYIVLLLCSAIGHLDGQSSCRPTVPVIALDKTSGAAIDSLAASDFRAKLKGGEIPIRAITNPPATRRLVFVLNRSGSMTSRPLGSTDSADNPRILANQSLIEAVSTIPNTYTVAFLVFSGKSSWRTEFMPPDSAKAKLADILAWKPEEKRQRRTPLWDNIDSALKMLNIHTPGDTIIVISDGDDNMSKLGRSKLENRLLAADVPVLAILIASSSWQLPEEAAAMPSLAEFTETTGGAFVIVGTPLHRPDANGHPPMRASQLLSLLADQHDLTVEIPDFHQPEKWRLTVNSARTGKEILLLYPQYLYPCSAAQ